MNRLILCEGKSDAILLGYFLSAVCGWRILKKPPKNLSIQVGASNESSSWYEIGEERLLICGVGGKDNFAKFFDKAIKNPMLQVNAFEKIAIVIDRDDRDTEEIERTIQAEITPFFANLKNQMWSDGAYIDSFGMRKNIEILLVIIPDKQQGALENVLMNAISEDPYDKIIVEKCKTFVSEIRVDAQRYITSDRLELKADLSVTWAIQSPQKVFEFIDKQIQDVEWEKSQTLRECFSELIKI